MGRYYKTKTQKKNALTAIEQKARRLYLDGVMSVEDMKNINRITNRAFNKL